MSGSAACYRSAVVHHRFDDINVGDEVVVHHPERGWVRGWVDERCEDPGCCSVAFYEDLGDPVAYHARQIALSSTSPPAWAAAPARICARLAVRSLGTIDPPSGWTALTIAPDDPGRAGCVHVSLRVPTGWWDVLVELAEPGESAEGLFRRLIVLGAQRASDDLRLER